MHLLAILLWLGGLLFELLTLFPVAGRRGKDADTLRFVGASQLRFGAVIWAAILLLVVSGVFNLINRMGLGGLSLQLMWILTVKLAALIVMIVLQHVRVTLFARRMADLGPQCDQSDLAQGVSARATCSQLAAAQLAIGLLALYFGLALRNY